MQFNAKGRAAGLRSPWLIVHELLPGFDSEVRQLVNGCEARAHSLVVHHSSHADNCGMRARSNAPEVKIGDAGLDLPRFRGGVRAWVQGIWSDGILSSCLRLFFCSAPAEFVFPSRPARL